MLGIFKKSEKDNYKFKEPKETACFICDHVLRKEKPILYVSHDEDGEWQFLCGGENHNESNAKVISLYEAATLDPSVNDLYEMPNSFGAERASVKDKWKPFRITD